MKRFLISDFQRALGQFNFMAIALIFFAPALADEWSQWRGDDGLGVWHEKGIIDHFESDQIALRWRVPISAGYSGPTVADGRVYVTDRVIEPQQVERIHCFDWQTGDTLWSREYPCTYSGVGYEAGPRAAVTIVDGVAISLGSMGDLVCLDAETGKVRWHHPLNETHKIRMPIWGIAASPVVYGDHVIVQIGGEGACVVAFEIGFGKEVWRALDDRASYSASIFIKQADKDVLLCWTGDNIVGLNPKTGHVYWSVPRPPKKMVINVPSPVVQGDRAFFSSFYEGSTMIRFGTSTLTAEMLWHRDGVNEIETDALHCMISTPLFLGDYIYGVDSYGQLRCLEAGSGDRVWEDLTATRPARWSNIHMVRHGENIWMFNEEGQLIIGRVSPAGFQEISRAQLIEPTEDQLRRRGGVCWSHPAFAYKHIFARNDRELVCANLGVE